jgi:hypothetical protein
MSLRIGFKQAFRVARPQQALRSAGSGSLYKRQASASWLLSSCNHITRCLASTTGGSSDSRRNQNLMYGDQDPVQLFNTHLANGTLTKQLALLHLKTLTRETRYDTGLGEATLKWMWNEHDSHESLEDKYLLEQTIRHLVREGKEELAWNWIQQKSRKPEFLGPKARFVWRSDTVSALISARAFSVDHDSLDGALETFFRAESSTYSIPLAPARMTMAQLLMMPREKMSVDPANVKVDIEVPRWPGTSTEKWEDFLRSLGSEENVNEPLSGTKRLSVPETLSIPGREADARQEHGQKTIGNPLDQTRYTCRSSVATTRTRPRRRLVGNVHSRTAQKVESDQKDGGKVRRGKEIEKLQIQAERTRNGLQHAQRSVLTLPMAHQDTCEKFRIR